MKTLNAVLLALGILISACAQKEKTGLAAGPEATVNVAAHYLDDIFMNTLASLELAAMTPEAKSGDWSGIKPYLEKLAADLPGAYFFVLPDGNYYSLEMDYTNLNLSNRPYFGSLFKGEAVIGFPVYSRSTGKRSGVVAAPILADRKIIGALGVSVFLDDLHTKLDRDFNFSPHYLWYVLDPLGIAVLAGESDLIFMNTLTRGGVSMREAVSDALKKESGVMTYEHEGLMTAHYRKLPNLNWWMVLAERRGAAPEVPLKLTLSLDRFVPDLKKRLDGIDASIRKCITEMDPDLQHEPEIRELLVAILHDNQDIVESNFITLDGILRYIEPADYKNFENTDISMQDHVIALRKDPKPEFSSGFMAVEGFLSVDLAYPVFDDKKELFGSVSVLIRPELLIDPLLKMSKIPADYELWIMQPDGMIIYDQDKDEIGKMLFSDPAYAGYESLLALGKKIAAEPNGEGNYVYLAPGSDERVVKDVVWQTTGLHEREWRVVLGFRPYEK